MGKQATTLNQMQPGQIAALERRIKPLNYASKRNDEVALGILKGMRFSGSVPTEAARRYLAIELNALKAEAALGLKEFKKLKKD